MMFVPDVGCWIASASATGRREISAKQLKKSIMETDMTRDEAIKELRGFIGQLTEGCQEAIKVLIPELAESDDERIRKEMIAFFKSEKAFQTIDLPKSERWIAWLEKQKDPPMPEDTVIFQKGVSEGRRLEREGLPYWQIFKGIGTIVPDDYILVKFGKGYKLIGPGDTIEIGTKFLQVSQLDNLPKEEKQKEQEPVSDSAQFEEGFKTGYELGCRKRKEHKPILEVFGFKVGDAVKLKDGDGRKHIIKSFEEIEGVHGPNFYHVEFEDDSARDGIYPDEKYPNGYYTRMEKFEEEQKPVERSLEDDHIIGFVYDLLNEIEWKDNWAMSKDECLRLLSNYSPQKPIEWSEQDTQYYDAVMDMITNARYLPCRPRDEMVEWLKSLKNRGNFPKSNTNSPIKEGQR